MRVLVCGGRDFNDRDAVFRALDTVHAQATVSMVIHGACCYRERKTELRGADRFAQEWAQENEVPYLGVPAPWKTLGKAAGRKRNRQMAEMKPDGMIAMPGGNGTDNMVNEARALGVKVWDLRDGAR